MSKIVIDRAVVEQALRALDYGGLLNRRQALAALRAALEQPQGEQEPVAWRLRNTAYRSEVFEYFKTKFQAESRQMQFNMSCDDGGLYGLTPLYTHPQPRQPLPEVEVVALYQSAKLHLDERPAVFDFVDGFRAAEQVYGIGGEK